MKRLTFKEYATPSVEVLSVEVEKGFIVSNPDWQYGGQGAAIATLSSYFVVYLIRAINTRRHLPFRQYPMQVAFNTAVVGVQALVMILRVPGWIWVQVGAIAVILAINGRPLVLMVMRRFKGRAS